MSIQYPVPGFEPTKLIFVLLLSGTAVNTIPTVASSLSCAATSTTSQFKRFW